MLPPTPKRRIPGLTATSFSLNHLGLGWRVIVKAVVWAGIAASNVSLNILGRMNPTTSAIPDTLFKYSVEWVIRGDDLEIFKWLAKCRQNPNQY
jgi:hypothetical protein